MNFLKKFYIPSLLLAAVLLLHITALIVVGISYISFPYETHHWGEWDVFSMSILISQGQSPYFLGDLTHATSVPYNFIYPLICALPVKFFGPHLWIGRAVSILSYIAILFLSAQILCRKYQLQPAFIAAGCILVILVQPITGYSLFKAHPNALCIATGLLTLYLAPQGKNSLQSWIPALIVGILCFFIKQTGALFLLALFPSILIHHRWNGVVLLLVVTGTLMAIVSGLNVLTDGVYGFFCFSLPSSYPLILNKIDDGIRFLASQSFIFIAASVPLIIRQNTLRDPVLTTGLLSIPASIYANSLWGGTETNFAFSLIPLALISAHSMSIVAKSLKRPNSLIMTTAITLVILQCIVPFFHLKIPGNREYAAAKRTAEIIGHPDQSVLALDAQQYAYISGKPDYTDAEAMKQFMLAGIRTFPTIERMISQKEFDIVAVHAPRFSLYDERDLDVFRLLDTNYRVAEIITSSSVYSPLLILRPDTSTQADSCFAENRPSNVATAILNNQNSENFFIQKKRYIEHYVE